VTNEVQTAKNKHQEFSVTLTVYDWDSISKHDKLGSVTVPLLSADGTLVDNAFESEQGKVFDCIDLQQAKQGMISFSIKTLNL
jgi:hypothetical protein